MPEAPDQLDANKVLIVEDNAVIRRLTQAYLPEDIEGIDIDHSTYATIDALAEEMHQRLVLSAILDGQLPGGKTAVELIRILQAQGREWVLVVMSANDEIVEAVRSTFPAIPAFIKGGNTDYEQIMQALEKAIASAVQRSTY